jgi:hypothetical protein
MRRYCQVDGLVIKVCRRDGGGIISRLRRIEARSAITKEFDANRKQKRSTEILIGWMQIERGARNTKFGVTKGRVL